MTHQSNSIPLLTAKVLTLLGSSFLALTLLSDVLFSLGAWAPVILSCGLMSLGGVLWSYFRYAHETPGIKNNDIMFGSTTRRGLIAWFLAVVITGFYILLYFYDDMKSLGVPPLLDNWIKMFDPLARLLHGGGSDRWFLYGALYTLAIIVMGFRMLLKYRGNRYQQIRTCSVTFFQLGFGFLIPAFLKRINEPEFYFTYFWPLKPEYLFPSEISRLVESGGLGVFMVFWSTVMALIITPVLSYYFGKRWYCSWVCGCGGLAETAGDPFRQNASTSESAWVIERWMIHTVLVCVVTVTSLIWLNELYPGAVFGSWSFTVRQWYGFYIGAIFSGVIGVGFYPILGSRVWCRFGCPMAAILGIFQRSFSRFRITVNGGQCISCGNCSTYCEMGIDVRGYAQREENIVRSSCVGCGVCAAVCPRGVLKLENGVTHADRFKGADKPLAVLLSALKERRIYSSDAE
jgi:Pyruvate/2-oxoacid:ferredoxin oxidoreductase delta subunit